ncbi:MAG: hypothetical protein KGL39_07560 [Patescibacteria group bacterium]|nr:hypothetical protein [Patescibacteria group bacterium]
MASTARKVIISNQGVGYTSPPPVVLSSEPYLARAEISRFSFNDFTTRGTWLIDRMRKIWPDLTERNTFGWLRNCIDSKEYHFTKTDRAVLMGIVTSVQLTIAPRVEEIFVFVDDPSDPIAQAHGALLYRDLRTWAMTCGASEILVANHSDVHEAFMEFALGEILQRDISFVKLRHAT